MPFVVGTNPSIENVYQLYWDAFETFRAVPTISTEEENNNFCAIVDAVLHTHEGVVPMLVQGLHESREFMYDKFKKLILGSQAL